ncbi:MAG: ABC transporter permease subunit [Rickettsiales bacterium]
MLRSAVNKLFIFLSTLSFTAIILIFVFLISQICIQGYKSFTTYKIKLPAEIYYSDKKVTSDVAIDHLTDKSKAELIRSKLDIKKTQVQDIVNINSLLDHNYSNRSADGKVFWVNVSGDLEKFLKSKEDTYINKETTDFVLSLIQKEIIKQFYNFEFFTNNNSSDPQNTGIGQAIKGSVYSIIICMLFALPIGLSTSIFINFYLKNSLKKRLLISHLNNLSSLPSVIYGVIGLYLFVNLMYIPRSSIFIAGLTLSLLATPMIIVISSNSFNLVDKSQIAAAYAIGLSKIQVILFHIIPQSAPMILTGTILTISRVMGETAPLIMIGMIAYISAPTNSVIDPGSTLPVQIYSWINNPDPAFISKASLAIMSLLLFILALNMLASLIKKYAQGS